MLYTHEEKRRADTERAKNKAIHLAELDRWERKACENPDDVHTFENYKAWYEKQYDCEYLPPNERGSASIAASQGRGVGR